MSESLALPSGIQTKSLILYEEEIDVVDDEDSGIIRKKDGDQKLYWVTDSKEYDLLAELSGDQKFESLELTDTTNQLILGTTNKTTINSVAPTSSRTYTIPDAGADTSFAMLDGSQTFSGVKTFDSGITSTLPVYGLSYDYQRVPFLAFRNPTNTDPSYPIPECYYVTGATVLGMSVRFLGSAGGVDYGTVQVKTRAAPYRIWLAYRTQNNHGIWKVSFDGVDKATYDLYSGSVAGNGGFIDLGTLTAGVHTIGFRGVGKNASSSNYLGSFVPIMYLIQTS